jgi:hypothetical protein
MSIDTELVNWEGEITNLEGRERYLANDPELCDRVFMSRHEAFISGLRLGTGDRLTDSDMRQLTHVMALPWGDIGPAIQATSDILELLMLLTPDEFTRWELALSDEYPSEFDIPVEYAKTLSTEDRFALVARLIRSLAMHYGARTDYALPPELINEHLGETEPNSPAYVLQELDNLAFAAAARKRRDRDGSS